MARKLGRRPNSPKHTYGLGRLEVLAAFINSATLLIVSTLICREAIVRLLHPEPIRGGIMLTVAVIGLMANLASALAAGSQACIQAMANKAKMQNIPSAKVLETVRIVRFALATKVLGEAEPVFAALAKA